jgi:hypothetical protein
MANVERLGVAVARVRFDRVRGTFLVGRPRIAVRVRETAWTTANLAAPGTEARLRPDPIWQFGFDVDPFGRPFVAVGGYGAGRSDLPRGSVTVARSNDGGATWVSRVLPTVSAQRGVRLSSLRPNVVAGRDFILVTLRTLDDRARDATMGVAATISVDGGRTWQRPIAVSPVRWHPSNLGDVTNGMGLRERAERAADDSVIWTFGDGRLAAGHIGRTAVFTVRLRIEGS